MTWMAISDHDRRRFSLRGLGAEKRPKPFLPDQSDALLTRGTILFEIQPLGDSQPHRLFGFDATQPYRRSLNFYTTPDGGIRAL